MVTPKTLLESTEGFIGNNGVGVKMMVVNLDTHFVYKGMEKGGGHIGISR